MLNVAFSKSKEPIWVTFDLVVVSLDLKAFFLTVGPIKRLADLTNRSLFSSVEPLALQSDSSLQMACTCMWRTCLSLFHI